MSNSSQEQKEKLRTDSLPSDRLTTTSKKRNIAEVVGQEQLRIENTGDSIKKLKTYTAQHISKIPTSIEKLKSKTYDEIRRIFVEANVLDEEDMSKMKLKGYHLYNAMEAYKTNLQSGGTKETAKEKMVTNLMEEEKVVSKSVATPIANWLFKLFIGENPLVMEHRILRSTSPFSGETMKFVNREGLVQKMAEVLLQNKQYQLIPEQRSLKWIIVSNYYGYGKTRLGLEFLNVFNKYLSGNDIYYKNDDFVQQMKSNYGHLVDELSKAQLFYIDLRDVGESYSNAKTIEELKFSFCSFIVCLAATKLDLNPHHLWQDYVSNYSTKFEIGKFIYSKIGECFLMIDEVQLISDFAMTFNNGYDEKLQRYHIAWEHLIMPLLIQKGISLYCCGKGAYLYLLGKGCFAEKFSPPSSIEQLFVNSFTKKNITDGMDGKYLTALKHDLMHKNLLDYFVQSLLDLTSGVADLCVIILNQASKEFTSFHDTTSIDGFFENQRVADKYDIARKHRIDPFVNKVYECLMLSSILEQHFDLTQKIKVPMNSIYQGLDRVSLGDIATKFDCYIESANNITSTHRIVFPKIILKEFQKVKLAVLPSQLLLLNHTAILDGDFFQKLVDCTMYSKIQFSIKSKNEKTIGELFSFLNTSFIRDDKIAHLSSKVIKVASENMYSKAENFNEQFQSTSCQDEIENFLLENTEAQYILWERFLDSIPNNIFVVPAPKSSSANSMIWIDKTNQKLLAIQVNNGEISWSMLKQEIEKLDRMRIGKYVSMKICFLVVALRYDSILSHHLNFGTKDYAIITEQTPLQIKPMEIVDTITCDKNTQVILLNENGLTSFLSKDVLHYLHVFKKAKETGDSYLATAFAMEDDTIGALRWKRWGTDLQK